MDQNTINALEALRGTVTEIEFEVPAKGKEVLTNQKAAKPKAPAKAKAPSKPKPAKAPKVTKQSQVNAIVANAFKGRTAPFSKTEKSQIITDIMSAVGMTKAGATTYFYNALKVL